MGDVKWMAIERAELKKIIDAQDANEVERKRKEIDAFFSDDPEDGVERIVAMAENGFPYSILTREEWSVLRKIWNKTIELWRAGSV